MSHLHADAGTPRGSTGVPLTIEPAAVAPASVARVERALAGAVRHHADTMLALRTAVEGCVRELAARELPPERVLIAMKGVVRHVSAAVPAPAPASAAPRWIADSFMDDVVRWTIGAYYGREIAPPAARRVDVRPPLRGTDVGPPYVLTRADLR